MFILRLLEMWKTEKYNLVHKLGIKVELSLLIFDYDEDTEIDGKFFLFGFIWFGDLIESEQYVTVTEK